ncbi:Hypothetical protein SMAX5B_004245 [Scophthalmus maximus]|uniref:Uncharacterized protein n=2 Tax=Scophthalmus maximus TaxID=52904 RepID=A0A2U9B8I1_SCOMX|nr:Hypothetical protein SMAX5B_004245 [Scophthalmus maximus]
MLRTRNPRGESFGQMQPEAAVQQQNYPRYMMPSLHRTLQVSKKVNQQLTAANAALRGQIARLTSSWEKEKNMLVEDSDVLVARRELDKMAKTMVQSMARQRALDTENEHMALDIEAKNLDIVKLSAHLRRQEAENQELEAQILQSDDTSQDRVTALQQTLGNQQETNSEREAELQQKIRDGAERWLTMQQDSERRVSRMEEDICLLILQNKELQELVVMSNKDKAKRKKVEKKAKKEEEKRQKRERKEKKEQEKEHMKRENEKREEKQLNPPFLYP